MNILESVCIENLWGRHKVDLSLHPSVNFLIGPNGSGKTTIINLIVAALTADFRPLLQTPFSTIEIKLKQVSGRKKPSIRLEKVMSQEHGSVSIRYKIRDVATAKWEEYPLEDIEEFTRYRYMIRRRHLFVKGTPDITGLKKRLEGFYKLTWLSIHRAKSFRQQEEEDTYDSTVDSKLMALSNEFVR
ncbi:AAA family ATPase, partial [candidate division WOR-3 bacterium]|nr:AAA family ATPase [candidate division WOR-3 bacterium]